MTNRVVAYPLRRWHPSLPGARLSFQGTLPDPTLANTNKNPTKRAYKSTLTINELVDRTTTAYQRILTKYETACTEERMHEV